MKIQVREMKAYIHNIHTRMPFRYGIAELTSVPHFFMQLDVDIDGLAVRGVTAESLIPKWFTKDKDSAYQDDLEDMFEVIGHAVEIAMAYDQAENVFDIWHHVYEEQEKWANAVGHPSLLWNMGVSLVERALLDAYCRYEGETLAGTLETNSLGIRLREIHPELEGTVPANWLTSAPLSEINLRHTVGLSDRLFDEDIPEEKRVTDGLPQSLAANVSEYGLRFFKIKINGDLDRDLERLCQIRDVLEAANVDDYRFTLDGNEQYRDVASFKRFWDELIRPERCALDLDKLLFVEQPFHRDVALSEETTKGLMAWETRPLMIIDESDSELTSMRIAFESGYAGTSHKNCKGIFKSIANACLLAKIQKEAPETAIILSGEDLANVGPVALMQDLAMMALLGISHVERNGHQYFAGLSGFPAGVQEEVLASYPDLYEKRERFASLKISEGKISTKSVNYLAFGGSGFVEPSKWFQPKSSWKFESLDIQ